MQICRKVFHSSSSNRINFFIPDCGNVNLEKSCHVLKEINKTVDYIKNTCGIFQITLFMPLRNFFQTEPHLHIEMSHSPQMHWGGEMVESH